MRTRRARPRRGQAIIEYVLVAAMVAAIIAVIIRGSTVVLYDFWSGLTSTVASPCPECTLQRPPQLP
jgi:Flp pilus assembly pilin Flp